MSIAKSLIFNFNLILEVTAQLSVSLFRELAQTILHLQLLLRNITEFMVIWSGKAEDILEPVLHGRIVFQEIIKTLGQSSHDHNGIIIPLIHLNK